jgi:hypothetical protein
LGYAGDVTLVLAAIPVAVAIVVISLPLMAVVSLTDAEPAVPSTPDSYARPACDAPTP